MNRKELDAFAAHYGLSADAVESTLAQTDARPSPTDITRFGVRLLHLAGVLSIAAGVVFFVAANWSALAIFGRFALVQAALLVAVGLALWRPPPHAVGRYALLLGFLVTGALFALYGQTYQTGADVYELFLNWSLLGLVLVVAAQWSVVWAAWVLVLNVALLLFCAARPAAGLFWRVLGSWELSLTQLLLVPLGVNMLLWLASIRLERSRWSRLAPSWLGRFTLACAVGFGTWAAMIVVLRSGVGFVGLVVPLGVFAAIVTHTLRRRVDVFPLAMIEASLIVLTTTWIVQHSGLDDIGLMLVISLWLIVSSTVSGRYLMHLVRTWDTAEGER